jgi:hypothetical protein
MRRNETIRSWRYVAIRVRVLARRRDVLAVEVVYEDVEVSTLGHTDGAKTTEVEAVRSLWNAVALY